MKNLFYALVAISMFLTSCSDDSVGDNALGAIPPGSYHRDYNSALSIAEKAVLGDKPTTRSVKAALKDFYMYTPTPVTRSASEDTAVSFYVFNFENDGGFAVVSEDKRATPVYAYSDSGNLDLNEAVKESGWGDFMDAACDYYKVELKDTNKLDLIDKNPYGDVAFVITEEINGVLCKVTKSQEGPFYANTFLSTTWNQWSPYNYYYPYVDGVSWVYDGKAAVGCAVVALGQIMAYHRYPAYFNKKLYNWDAILSKSEYYMGEYTTASLATASLLYDIACVGKANMGKLTSMSFKNSQNVLDRFGYKYAAASYASYKVWNSLKNDSPVFIQGFNDDAIGHAWVIDGGKMMEYITNYHDPNPPFDVFKRDVSESHYFHCNWGWGSSHQSSAYCLNVFESPDDGAAFDKDVKIIYNIQPK